MSSPAPPGRQPKRLPDRGVFRSSRSRWEAFAVLVVLGVGLVALALLADRLAPELRNPAYLRELVRSAGVLAPLVFVLVQAAQVVLAPVPGQVLGFVAGMLFGPVLGTAYSLIGAALGTAIAVALGRRLGRPFVERVVRPDLVTGFDAATERRGTLALFVVFLVPGLPDDLLCFVAGLTPLSVRRVVLVSTVGRLPGYALVVVAGDGYATAETTTLLVALAVLVVVTAAAYARREAVLRWLGMTGEG